MKSKQRRKPYTEIGIKRLKCFRCGGKPNQQWQICSDNNQYRPLCDECDIKLNEMVLKFMGFKNWKELLKKYKDNL